jgi:uncharacterized membrane protein YkoI
MKRKRLVRLVITMAMTMVMVLAAQLSASAASPAVEEVEHKGKGRVEMEFYGKVQYKNVKVTVKDTSGKKYKVTRVRKDSDDIDFNIKNYKRGKTYIISVKGVRARGTVSYGTASGKLTIPKAATGSAISAKKAISIAKKDAANKWKAKGIWDVEVEKDRFRGQPVWEVSFSGTIRGDEYEFEYEIARKGGNILRREKEYDD